MGDQLTHDGPVLADAIQEVQGIFATEAALQDAAAKLTMAGFDRADISLPTTLPPAAHATPEQGAASLTTEDDLRQARTMGTSMAGTVGAFAAAGATIATGGAAGVAIAAAAAVGVGSALAANAVGSVMTNVQHAVLGDAAASGQLVLAVHADTAERQALAESILRGAGAAPVAAIERKAGLLSASSVPRPAA